MGTGALVLHGGGSSQTRSTSQEKQTSPILETTLGTLRPSKTHYGTNRRIAVVRR